MKPHPGPILEILFILSIQTGAHSVHPVYLLGCRPSADSPPDWREEQEGQEGQDGQDEWMKKHSAPILEILFILSTEKDWPRRFP